MNQSIAIDEVVYEYPFNERMRLFLRLESVLEQAFVFKTAKNKYETQLCLDALFALLSLTNRYELRAELLRELERIKSTLLQLKKNEQSEDQAIDRIHAELTDCAMKLHGIESKHIDRLRNMEFLNTVKNRNVHETGSYLFEIPALQHWITQPVSIRELQIDMWLEDFMPFKQAIECLLRLIRESSEQEHIIADNGVYIRKVGMRASKHQLLRIILPEDSKYYPRVSGDKYRFAVRFMEQNQMNQRATQSHEQVAFIIHGCGI